MRNRREKLETGFDGSAIRQEIDPPTGTEVKDLLMRPVTLAHIANALRKTNTQGHRLMGRLLGQEHGFVVYGNPSQVNRSLHISPLWEGREGSIDLYELSIAYLAENPEIPKVEFFDFHTHTYLYLPVLRELLCDKKALETDDREIDIFSERDLRSYLNKTAENPFRIRGLGTEKDGKGRLILISFNNLNVIRNFNFEEVHARSIEYLKTGKDPLDAYREAGLNVATIAVDLSSEPIINESDIEKASTILTIRT